MTIHHSVDLFPFKIPSKQSTFNKRRLWKEFFQGHTVSGLSCRDFECFGDIIIHNSQQQSGMVIKYHSKSLFTFFIFSKMTEAVYEEQDGHNAPTNENRNQFVAPSDSSEQEPSLKEIDSGDILLLAEADVPGASLSNKDPSE